jgi:hypothetical protein
MECQIDGSAAGFTPSASTKRLVIGQYIEIGDNQPVLLQKARKLLDICGYPGMPIEVQLVDGTVLTA